MLLNGREVDVTDTEFEYGEGVQVVAAYFVDTGAPLTDDECREIEEAYQGELYQDAVEHAVCAAEDAYEDR